MWVLYARDIFHIDVATLLRCQGHTSGQACKMPLVVKSKAVLLRGTWVWHKPEEPRLRRLLSLVPLTKVPIFVTCLLRQAELANVAF